MRHALRHCHLLRSLASHQTSHSATCTSQGLAISTAPCCVEGAIRGCVGAASLFAISQHVSLAAMVRRFGTMMPFPLAQTGEGINECELLQWFVKEGDMVAEFDKVCEVQSDKATIEITSRYAGRVAQLLHAPGAVVKVGETLVHIELDDGQAALAPPASSPGSAAVSSGGGSNSAAGSSPEPDMVLTEGPKQTVQASPAVRLMARDLGLDVVGVRGTGPLGRITKEDLNRHLAESQTLFPPASTPLTMSAAALGISSNMVSPGVVSQPTSTAPGTSTPSSVTQPPRPPQAQARAESTSYAPPAPTRQPLRGYRRAMVKSMTSATAIPHFHFCDEVHMDALMATRKALQDDPLLCGARLTHLPLLLKALSAALLQHPTVNASLCAGSAGAAGGGDELLLHSDHNIGVAMATPQGLVVPNVKQVQLKSVADIAHDLSRLQALAAAGQLGTHDMAHGTISVSNIGSIGGTYATPLVSAPEVAIVALGRIQHLPRFDAHGAVVRRAVMSISWGADHRVVDGAALAHFSNCWKSYLEEPRRLLLHTA